MADERDEYNALTTLGYDTHGNLGSVAAPLARTTTYTRDALKRGKKRKKRERKGDAAHSEKKRGRS